MARLFTDNGLAETPASDLTLQAAMSPLADLEQLEKRVRAGLRGSLDAGAALKEIRDRGLYRARGGYQTFEAYCHSVWKMTPRHSGRLIDFHDTVVAVCETGPSGPLSSSAMNEGTLRPLARLSSANKLAAFQAAVEFAATERRPVAARHVTLAVQDIRKAAGRTAESFSDIIKPTDNWNFNPVRYGRIDGEDGHGYVPGEIYANCLWYYTKPGDVVAAPMAGSGQIMRVYEARHEWAVPEPWELDIRMFDLNPRGRYADMITHNDLTKGLPVERADYIVMDVPYFGMVEGQYSDKPEDLANMALDDWSSAMNKIAAACAEAQAEGALCTVICTNYSDVKTRRRVVASKLVEKAFEHAGYELFWIDYAPRHIQQNQDPFKMGKSNNLAKENRTPLTDMAVVLTFVRNAAANPKQQTRVVGKIAPRKANGGGYKSEVIGPLSFYELPDENQIDGLIRRVPTRWANGQRDSIGGLANILGETRDFHLYRKVGCRTWADYCRDILREPSEAMDKLIECFQIMRQG